MRKLLIILSVIITCFCLSACEITLGALPKESSSSGRKTVSRSYVVSSSSQISVVEKSSAKQSAEKSKENSVITSEITESSRSEKPIENSSVASKSESSKSESSKSQSSKSQSSKSESSKSQSSASSSEAITLNYDARVDATFSGSNGSLVGGVKTYKTVGDALNAIGSASDKVIYIESGSYKEKLTISKPKNLTLIGSSSGETKLTYGDCSTVAGGTNQSASITVLSEGFTAINIHFENSYDYLNGSEKDKQAVAFHINADRGTFYNCKFSGHQDTLLVNTGRHYMKNCVISGSVDFIFGNNPSVLFDGCNVVSRNRNASNGGYITAMKGNDGTNGSGVATYGLVFNDCSFTAESGVKSGSVALGRPWRADATVTFMNSEIGSHISTKAYADGKSSGCRYVYMSGGGVKNHPQNAYFTEYNNTGAGAISSAVNGCKMLTKSQAEKYTMANIFAKTNGAVNYSTTFDPLSVLAKFIK